MGYVAAVEETLKVELNKAGYNTDDNGAHHIYLKVFTSELDKLNTRLEALEAEPV